MATRQGLVKKTDLMEYSRPRQGGIIGISLEEGDELIDVVPDQPGDEVVLSARATAWRSASTRPTPGRWAATPRREGHQAVGETTRSSAWSSPTRTGYLLTVCENGYGKRTPFGPNSAGSRSARREADGRVGRDEAAEPTRRRAEATRATNGRRPLGDALPPAAPRRQGRQGHEA